MHLLDNVIWNALNTLQAHLGASAGEARKYHREVSLLGGFLEPSPQAYAELESLVDTGERVGLFLDADPVPPSGWAILASIPLLQMVCEKEHPREQKDNEPVDLLQLGQPDVAEMLALTKLTKPGPFARRTREMGDYFGIRQNGGLAAMAGERLRLPGYTEISAVCTHPEHLGQGHARRLVTLLLTRIHARREQAFLHVRADNTRAVQLYERLRFKTRRTLQYGLLVRQ